MHEKSSADHYREKVLRALQTHVAELRAMESSIVRAAERREEIPNLKEIFKELGDATAELRSVNEFYQDEKLPSEVWNVVSHTLNGLTECNTALVLYASLLALRKE